MTILLCRILKIKNTCIVPTGVYDAASLMRELRFYWLGLGEVSLLCLFDQTIKRAIFRLNDECHLACPVAHRDRGLGMNSTDTVGFPPGRS